MPATNAAVVAKKRSSRSASGTEQNGSANNGTKRPATELKPIGLQELYELEDKEALSRSQADDEATFVSECDQLKKAVVRFVDNPSDEGAEELKTTMTLHMIQMRRLNRLAQYRNRKMRDRAAAERLRVEEQHLQLQNHSHEIEHLQKEVDRCLEFKSADQDIALVSVSEFYQMAPPEISKPETTKDDGHQQRLARLTWELEERKSLSKQLQELQERKNLLASDIGAKEQRLDSLKPMVQTIMDAAKPMQEVMNIKSEAEMQQRELAHMLPKDLYVIGIQARAYKEIAHDDKFEVQYGGDVENAKKLGTVTMSKSASETPEDVDSGNEDEERREDAAEEHAQRLSSRKRRATVSEAVERRRELVLLAHPLHVVFAISCADKNRVLVTFEYLTELRAISVKCRMETENADMLKAVAMPGHVLNEETLLQQLFSGDTGLTCPNPVGQAKLEHLNIEYETYVSRVGFAFHWAQQLAGIKVSDSTMDRTTREALDRIHLCDLLQKIIGRIRRRLQTRLSLHSQILSLDGTKISLPKALASLQPTKVLSRLTSWKTLSSDDFKAHPATQSIQTALDAGALADGWFFSATMERGEAKMVALVHVGHGYPDQAPLFVLLLKSRGTRTASDCCSLKALEESVNCTFTKSVPRAHKASLLSAQLQYLLSRLDILLEAESVRQGSKDFARDHLFGRKSRGPDREMPFAYQESSNSFTFA